MPRAPGHEEPKPTTELIRTFCRLCEVGCGLVATVEDGQLARLRPDHDHPVTSGFACSKGLRGADLHHDPDRVRSPQRRDEGSFASVGWDDAIGDIASRVETIIAEHGPNAVGAYIGNPTAFNALGSASGMYFATALGTDRKFSAVTQDCSNKYAVAELLYGVTAATPIPDLTRTDLLLWIGSNPRVSKSSFLSIPDPVQALRQVRERGGRVVFVDPREVEPDIGETLQLRPDSDPYLLAAMLHEIERTVGFDLGSLEGRVDGLDDVRAFVTPYSPGAVAETVGLPAATIAALARDFASAERASIHASTGLNMGRQGALAYWLVQMLLLVTGNLDRPGGNYFATRGFPVARAPVDRSTGCFEQSPWGSFRRSVGMLPSAVLPEYIHDSHEPLRALFVVAGNPALTVGGGAQLEEALRSLDLLVCIDLYRNATGELADYILPATDQFEREDLNVFVQGVQGEPFVQWSPRVVEPRGEQRQEWEIYGALLQAMGREPLLVPGTEDPMLLFDGALAPGGTSIGALRDAGGVVPLPEPGPGGSLGRLGVDGTIDTVPDALASTLARGHALFAELRDQPNDTFKLITRRTRNTINSTLHNLPTAAPDDEPNPLWMNPDDGRRLGIAAGERVEVSNVYGTIEAGVRYDPRLRPGVVAMTHGFGNASTSGMPGAQAHAGVNVNVLAPHGPGTFDPISCMSQVTGIPVDVRHAGVERAAI
jgi:anaerobic selenocysteine-containing dehydrogenase